jgi:hypothetical protein
MNKEIYLTRKQMKEELGLSNRETEDFMEKYMEVFKTLPSKQHRQVLTKKELKGDIDFQHYPKLNDERIDDCISFLKRNVSNNSNMLNCIHFASVVSDFRDLKGLESTFVYQRKGGGRLYQRANYNSNIVPQQLPSKFRAVMFEGQYAYDINTAVINVFYQLYWRFIAKKCNFYYIEEYIRDKEQFRQELVKEGFTYKQAKQYFTALLFGANLSTNLESLEQYSTIVKSIGGDNLVKALNNTKVQNIVEEIIYLYNELGEYFKQKALENAKELKTKYKVLNTRGTSKNLDKWNNPKVLSFIYNGVESQILDIVCKRYDISLLLFDEFISPNNIDLEELSRIVMKELGYDLTFSKEKLESNFEELLE